jgi:NADH-quinone oxidoreductase chain I
MRDGLLTYTYKFIKSIYTGMAITLYYFVNTKEVVTMQYPDEKWEMPPRFRGFHSVAFEGKEACIGCLQCQKICSERAILIKTSMGEDKKRKIDEFYLNLGTCSFCGNCQEVCPVKAIKMGCEYEGSVQDKKILILDKEKLRRKPLPVEPKPVPAETKSEAGPAGPQAVK